MSLDQHYQSACCLLKCGCCLPAFLASTHYYYHSNRPTITLDVRDKELITAVKFHA